MVLKSLTNLQSRNLRGYRSRATWPREQIHARIDRQHVFRAVKVEDPSPGARKPVDMSLNEETKKVQQLASKIQSMPEREVEERYHELIDKRPNLSSIERFELDRINARLDAEDFDPEQEGRKTERERERVDLLKSIEALLERLHSRI